MNKKIISIICLALIACMICTFVSCNKDKGADEGTNPGTECTAHVDENGDGKCDVCDADVESKEPDVPAIDATKDVPNAVKLLNKMLKGDIISGSDTTDVLKLFMTLSNVDITGNLVEPTTETVSLKSIAIDGDMVKLVLSDGDVDVETYMVFTDAGVYSVTVSNGNYETSFQEFDMTASSETNIPELTESDVRYDEATGYFIVSDEYVEKLFTPMNSTEDETDMPIMTNDMTDSGMDMVGGLVDVFANLKYEMKFKVSAENEIAEFNVKGAMVQNDIRTEHVAFVVKNNDTEFSVSLTLNYYVNINMNIKCAYGTDGTDKLLINLVMTPPVGADMETQELHISADVVTKEQDIEITDVVQAHLDEAANLLSKIPAIKEKYSNIYKTNEIVDCDTMCVYDVEHAVYVVLTYDWVNEGYVYDSCVKEFDEYNMCLVTISGDNIVVEQHSGAEQDVMSAMNKYDGTFTANTNCDTIAVWDESLGQYVMFEMDFFEDGVYEFDHVTSTPYDPYCIGTVDLDTKVITVTEHSAVETFINSVRDTNFTVNGYTECSSIFVEHVETGYYLFFYRYSETEWKYSGYTNWGPTGCEATIDLTTNTLTIVDHDHTN